MKLKPIRNFVRVWFFVSDRQGISVNETVFPGRGGVGPSDRYTTPSFVLRDVREYFLPYIGYSDET